MMVMMMTTMMREKTIMKTMDKVELNQAPCELKTMDAVINMLLLVAMTRMNMMMGCQQQAL